MKSTHSMNTSTACGPTFSKPLAPRFAAGLISARQAREQTEFSSQRR